MPNLQLAKISKEYHEASIKPLAITVSDFRATLPVEAITDRFQALNTWIIKLLFDSRVKIPYHYQPLKKHAELLKTIFLLCERCHSFKLGNNYKNASDWFHDCLRELCTMELDISLNNKLEPIDGSWKKAYIAWNRNFYTSLKNNQNPFNSPALSQLIQASLEQKSDGNTIFFNEKWKPFLSAYSAYVTDLQKNSKIHHGYIENNKYIIQNGKGKSNASKITVAQFVIED
jgi:hypothetical protein